MGLVRVCMHKLLALRFYKRYSLRMYLYMNSHHKFFLTNIIIVTLLTLLHTVFNNFYSSGSWGLHEFSSINYVHYKLALLQNSSSNLASQLNSSTFTPQNYIAMYANIRIRDEYPQHNNNNRCTPIHSRLVSLYKYLH